MRKSIKLIIGMIILLSSVLWAGTTTIDFETDGDGYTASATEGSGDTDVFNRSNPDLGGNSSYIWSVEDLSLTALSFTLDQIDVSGQVNFTFSIDMIAHHFDDWDNNDELKITYSLDGGSSQNLMWVQNTGQQYNDPAALDTDFDGDGECGNVLPALSTGTGTDGCEVSSSSFETFTTSEISLSSNSTLDITLQFVGLTSTDEGIYIDNIVISTSSSSVSNPTSFSGSAASAWKINLSWAQNGNSDDVMVAYNTSDTFGEPSGTYSADDGISGGGTVIYNGSATSSSHSSLSANTTYYYKAWSVDGSNNYSSGVTTNATTAKVQPSNHVSSFTVAKDGTIGHSAIDITWSANDGPQAPDGYLIKASTADNISDPVDGTEVADNSTIGSDSGAKNITHGTNTYEWTGLSAETSYYFKVYPYTNSGTLINFKTNDTVPSGSATTDAEPEIPALLISEVTDPGDQYKTKYVELYNASGSTIDFSTTTFYLSRQANGGSIADIQLTGSLAAAGVYVIAYDQTTFEDSFEVTADIYSSSISGNGDDGYMVYYGGGNATGTLYDIYGVIDQDGSGEAWEYENSRAVRSGVTSGNTTWTASEWEITSADAADCTPGVLDNDQSLPVELSTWTAISAHAEVKLTWTTDSEIENQGFILSRDGQEISSFLTNSHLQGQGSTNARTNYTYVDKNVMVSETYSYKLTDVDYQGKQTDHAVISVTVKDEGSDLKPAHVRLESAYPNPFNPDVSLSFSLNKEASNLMLEIYDIQGSHISTLTSGYYDIGSYDFNWNGRDLYGDPVPSGIYLVRLSANSIINIQRVTLLK